MSKHGSRSWSCPSIVQSVWGFLCWFFRWISGVGQGEVRSWGIVSSSRSFFRLSFSVGCIVSAVGIGWIFRESVHNYIAKYGTKFVYRFGTIIPVDYAVELYRVKFQWQLGFLRKSCWSLGEIVVQGVSPAIARREGGGGQPHSDDVLDECFPSRFRIIWQNLIQNSFTDLDKQLQPIIERNRAEFAYNVDQIFLRNSAEVSLK